MTKNTVIFRLLGQKEYLSTWAAMQAFTNNRQDETPDEIWLLEHFPVFTQGQNGKAEHLLNTGHIPVVQTDRGGQVTYHGKGQLMIYTLLNLKRKQWTIRKLVCQLEQVIIDVLGEYNIKAHAHIKAPGVYVADKKIASIGLRIRRGCAYHGIAFNICMDLEPFNRINPCGFAGLHMTQLAELTELLPIEKKTLPANHPLADIFLPDATDNILLSLNKLSGDLINYLMKNLGYTTAQYIVGEMEK